ncbi:MAG TPA: PHB depolymerase family esterase [Pseudonocardiaceae bacterium]|jgi:poly(hydroxyalkanoate) depolymerase family esterase|nr:PHB depolymerase family esterase [Pseudonocardiaceae bacterium]
MRKMVKIFTCVMAMLAAAVAVVLSAPSASAASLVQITNFGNNPSNLNMFLYVPNNVAPHPAILVAVHYCGGSGPVFFSGTQFASLADQFGFIVIYPSVTRSSKCFDVSSPGALTHNGNSDPAGIVSMVQYVEQHNNGDPSRVYVTGASSGGMTTDVMLGDYPDVFKAGAAFMGVPFACFATTDGSMWNTQCANGQISKTPQQWGDLVRGADPGYSGPRPRVQLWHGTADGTLNFNNFGEEIKQWTNVFGVSQTPTSTSTPQSGWTHTTYGSGGAVDVDAYSIAGAGHVLPLSGMAAIAIQFFGLNGTPPPPPPTTTNNPPPTTTNNPPPTTTGNPPPPSGCKVTDMVNAWNTGFTSNLTITNTGGTAINGWSLVFTMPSGESITSSWNATFAPASGQVTATNLSYNAAIAPGASTGIGFQAAITGTAVAPTSFTLNGQSCTVA